MVSLAQLAAWLQLRLGKGCRWMRENDSLQTSTDPSAQLMWCKFGSPPNKLQGAHSMAEGVWGVCLKCCIIIESFLYSLKELQLRLPTTHIRPSPELVGQMKHGCVLWLTDSNLIGEWWECKAGGFHSLVAINLSKINMNMGALSGWAFADIWDTLKRL
jgi:hypothetical protein